jgi:hypothetical protein
LLVWLHGAVSSVVAKGVSLMWFAFWIGVSAGVLIGMFIVSVFIGADEDGR